MDANIYIPPMGRVCRHRSRREHNSSCTDPVFSSNACETSRGRRTTMAKSKPWSHGIPLFMLLAVAHLSLISCESDRDRVEELRNLQERAPSGVIHLDDSSLQRFAVRPKSRSYSLIIFFDAVHLRDKSELRLEDLRKEYELMARTYIENNKGQDSANKVFFCELEFQQSQASFNIFGVNVLPHVRHVGPGHGKLKDSDVMDQSELTRTAESMAAFVESKTKQRVGPIERPPPISKKQMVFVAGVLLLAAPFVVKKLLTQDTPLHEPKVWLAFAIFVYFFSVSGAMHNIIRKMPLFLVDRGNTAKLVFFYQASGMQLGAEGFVVGFLYTVVGLLLAFVTHFLVYVKSRNLQRLFMLVVMVVSYWAVRKVVSLDNWKTGYEIHGFWPSRWG